MPRSGALLPHSREHHGSLVLARDSRAVADTPQALAAMRTRWLQHHEDMREHFALEEVWLQRFEDRFPATLIACVLQEHATLREAGAWLANETPSQSQCVTWGELLAGHVRFEERIWFPLLQPLLDAENEEGPR